ncbi:MAG: hypothetical protein K5798_03695 [Nitrosopumilus sp.]|uniref:hypothetical protein n=1 Tax=Nitrosopumilus sp. TaxID=2024843 RepID=UPI00242B6ABD|nr:hypothetical protein [Nitrosopumilus sp.]MCV0366356.1 hypothetical protein [Nitrosopumilus sp.]
MVSIDKAAIIWSVLIVFVAVEITLFGNASETAHHDGKIDPIIPDNLKEQISHISKIHFQTDKEVYNTGDIIMISGYVDRILYDTPITIVLANPLEDIVTIAQVTVDDDKTFVEYFKIGGSLWVQNGIYTATVRYGEKNIAETNFMFLSDLDPDDLL